VLPETLIEISGDEIQSAVKEDGDESSVTEIRVFHTIS